MKLKDSQSKTKFQQKTALCSSSYINPKWNEVFEWYAALLIFNFLFANSPWAFSQPVEATDDFQIVIEDKVSLGVGTFLGRV